VAWRQTPAGRGGPTPRPAPCRCGCRFQRPRSTARPPAAGPTPGKLRGLGGQPRYLARRRETSFFPRAPELLQRPLHCGPPDVHRSRGRQSFTALSQGGLGSLLMELLNDAHIRSDLPRVATPMGLGRYAARVTVAAEQGLDKAETHPKETCQLPLCTLSPLVCLYDLVPQIRRLGTHHLTLPPLSLTSSLC
jgi:hypothetical protein